MLARIVAVEFLTVAVTAYFASVFYHRVVLLVWPPADQYISAALFIAVLTLIASTATKQFVGIQSQAQHRFVWSGVGAVALAFCFFLSILFILKESAVYSRGTLFFQFVFVSVAIGIERSMTYAWLQSAIAAHRVQARRVVLIGDQAAGAHIFSRLLQTGIQIVSSFPLPQLDIVDRRTADAPSAYPELELSAIIAACRTLRPDDIVLLVPDEQLHAIARIADSLSELPVSIHVVPASFGDLPPSTQVGALGNIATMQVLQPPLSMFDRFIKRTLDIVAAGIGLVVLSPLFLAIAVAIKLDSRGPIFFRQTRHGYNNERIRVWKFRSMHTLEDGDAFRQVGRNDSRVTGVGRILRRTNLDELPQLLNVLWGDMSIVGPRPHATAHNQMFEEHIPPLWRRHKVKPGITGWAQVNGCRGETDTLEKMQQRVELDLYYIDNWSFMLDLEIIGLTLFSKSAYSNAY